MLPIITIGLTDAARPIAEDIADGRGVWHFANNEDALWTLSDSWDRHFREVSGVPGFLPEAVAALDGDGETWFCHVIYGENILGEVNTREPELLPIKGGRLVIIDNLGEDQGAPRRVRDGQPEQIDARPGLYSAVPRLKPIAVASAAQVDRIGIAALTGQLAQVEADLTAISAKEG